MEKKELILNDALTAEALKKQQAEMEELQKPVTPEEADKYIKGLDDWDLTHLLPKGTVVGEVNFAVKKGEKQAYGFARSSASPDIFVSPRLMAGLKDGMRVAVLARPGDRPSAERIVDVWQYVDWHKNEIVTAAITELEAKKSRELKWTTGSDPTNGWEEMKAKAKLLGLNLVEVRKCTHSFNYGGRGEDTYIFADGDVINEEKANELLTALGERHASTANDGPYDHGHDYVSILVDKVGFVNRWTGPYTD